jgi:hypothetical protein
MISQTTISKGWAQAQVAPEILLLISVIKYAQAQESTMVKLNA